MKPEVFIFIGKSGSGKGTQVDLLTEFLKKNDPKRDIVYLQTGKVFRDFIQGKTYTQTLSNKIYEAGGLQPEFLAINMWSNYFVEHMKPDAHVIIDGTPRKPTEAKTLDSAIQFYNWSRPHVFHIEVSHDSATTRLIKRGRFDDSPQGIKSRLDWFESDVAKALEFYHDNAGYYYHQINGEPSPEEVHRDILNNIGFSS